MIQRIRNISGFGLIELTVVIIIVGILVAVAMQSATMIVQDARRVETEREMEMLAKAIVGDPAMLSNGHRTDFGYVGDVGSFPTNLQALYESPGGYSTWDGPYILPGLVQDSTGFKMDEWGSLYNYSGGVTITSTGSGSTITEKVADAVTDYTLNTLNGSIRDANDSVPGLVYLDSVDIKVTVPDGAGSNTTKSYSPDAAGSFTLDSLPVGTHPLRLIYTPNVDTLLRYVTILPRNKSSVSYKFASAYFSGGGSGGCSGPGSETLRPVGAGNATNLVTDGCGSNYLCVDDVSTDDDATYVKSVGTSYGIDTYATADPTDTTCTITSVTVYVRARRFVKTAYAQVVLRTNGADYTGSEETLGSSFFDYSQQWTNNPFTGSAWTWTEVTDMEIGVKLRSTKATHPARCTQVWVVVAYTN